MPVFECYPPTDELMPAEAARASILDAIPAAVARETVALAELAGRVSAAEVRAGVAIPPRDNSAMDGFAVRAADLASGQAALEVVGTAWAGRPFGGKPGTGETVRIMTGAFIPEGADAVVPREQARDLGERVEISGEAKPGQHIRLAGEDTRVGDVVLRAGESIDGAMTAVLASIGIGKLDCYRKPVVGILSTGDELLEAGQQPREGRIFDSNRPLLRAMLNRLGLEPVDFGIARDDMDELVATLKQAAAAVDVLFTSGGASTGEADFLANALHHVGQVGLWRVALRPGRPFAFGRVGDAWLFGLPGNPVAVAATFVYFARPALLTLMGSTDPLALPAYPARCAERIRKKPERVEIYRARTSIEDGELKVRTTGSQGSGLLRSLVDGDALFTLESDDGPRQPGDIVMITPMSEIL